MTFNNWYKCKIITTHVYKHLIITYNGEIYNYLEIKNKLIQKGYKFETTSDTEVVLLAWLEWSNKCLELFEGMFVLLYGTKNKDIISCKR